MGEIKIEPLKRYHFKDNISFETETLIGGPRVTRAAAQLAARVMEMSDEVIVNACVDAAREAGITDLYMLDKKFVIDALTEKLERAARERSARECGGVGT